MMCWRLSSSRRRRMCSYLEYILLLLGSGFLVHVATFKKDYRHGQSFFVTREISLMYDNYLYREFKKFRQFFTKLSNHSLENSLLYWLEISKSNEFIGKRIGVYSFIPFSHRFILDSYQNLQASVPAHITTACFQNAFEA